MNTISEQEKNVIKEYIEKQLAFQNFEDVCRLQDSYFGTSSLQYMTFIVPNAKTFGSLDDYKTKLQEVLAPKS